MKTPRTIAFVLLGLWFAGCSAIPMRDGAVAGPFYTPANVKAVAQIPANVRRVMILPAAGGPAVTEATLMKIDAACKEELTRTAKFEVVTLSRDALAELTGSRQLSSVDKLPPALLDKLFNIYNTYGADAVLFIDVTACASYPPLVLGLRTKLAAISDGEILWATDNVFSAAEPAVANSARRHAAALGTDRGTTTLNHTILQNPSRFASYVAFATFQTLPPR